MRPLFALLMLFTPWLSANQDFVPPLENIVAVGLELTCQRPYVATVRFYNLINEPLRVRLIHADPAGYWNSFGFNISISQTRRARRDRMNSIHYEGRVLEDIYVVLPAGGELQSISNLDEQFTIPEEGFTHISYSSTWIDVEFTDGSTHWLRVASDYMKFEDYCIREQSQ